MRAQIHGVSVKTIAAAVPRTTLSLETLGEQFGQAYVQRVQQSTGIHSVRIADPGMTASHLCAAAAEQILHSEMVAREDIDGIVFVSQSPDQVMPATSVLLQHRLGLSTACAAFDINYGCSGYIYGLFQGAMMIQSGACRNVLVCAGDVISPYLRSEDSHLRMVLGDAGSATLMTASAADMSFAIHSDGAGAPHLCIERSASQEYLHMDGTAIMNFALTVVPAVLDEVLHVHEWSMSEIDTFGLHQANQFILQYLTKKIRAPRESVPISVADVGNTGPASIPLMLSREGHALKDQGRLHKVALCGFGVGLSWGATTLSLDNTHIFPMLEI